jgi:hypothetical protein
MTQNNQRQDVLETEKPQIAPMSAPANDKEDQGEQPRDRSDQNQKPRAEAVADAGPPQPMAHPPEDTFVAVGTHPRPGPKGS